ncbi:MAG: endolytic transglycosylase MltG [Candidatus Pacebacteria bacterium]|nr:endolytic transglycosylase MltG [Candidatus Paceibacterota bacterium]
MYKFLITYICIIIGAVGLLWGINQILFSTGDQQAVVKVVIEQNQGVSHIADALLEKELIHSRLLFLLYSYVSGSYSKYQPGVYAVAPSSSLREIIKLLIGGPKDVTVTIIPGMTLREIDEMLAQNGVIATGTLLKTAPSTFKDTIRSLKNAKTLEGFLMPDTYRFKGSSDVEEVIETILANFKKENNSLSYQTLIKASLIEKEVPQDDDRVIVAGIIEKRLAMGMPLQIDATVRYWACGERFTNCGSFRRSDFSTDSPYNTYIYKGLPPAPICNPSQSAIDAARSPKASPFLYYLSDPQTSKTIFSKTLEEHNKNRALYLGL